MNNTPKRLYSSFSRGSGSFRNSTVTPTPTASSSAVRSNSSSSTRGRTKTARQYTRVRSLYSPPQWLSQLVQNSESNLNRNSVRNRNDERGMTIKAISIETVEKMLGRSLKRSQGRQRPFGKRIAGTSIRAGPNVHGNGEKSMAQLIKEAKPLVSHPLAKDFSFRPVPLQLAAFHSHLAFTPSHLPIPANLGTSIYTQARTETNANAASVDDLFSVPPPPSPFNKLGRAQLKSKSAITEHMSIISALSHPSHLSALPTGFETLMSGLSSDADEYLVRVLSEAETKNQFLAERDFSKSMEKLEGQREAQEREMGNGQQAEMRDVLQGVEALLGKLAVSAKQGTTEEGMGETVVEMDSVKRKRKKKISKHKYKKRRKATRAQRKRLGK